MLRKTVTSVTFDGNVRGYGTMAAGQGFEPQLPGPEPGVLPLDDPATAWGSVAIGYGTFGSPISSRYTGTRRFSASVSMRATTST